MNFQWSNIYVLQCLVVLNVNGLKLVPADRTVIKQNGTTRTISRYYLLPHENEKQNTNLGTETGFSKFLREFDQKSEKKNAQPGKKKVIDRYRIYIRRKLKKNANKDVSKSGNVNEKNRTDLVFNISTIAVESSSTPTVIIKQKPAAEDSDNEYILQKQQLEVNAAFPELIFDQKRPSETRETGENLLDTKDPHEILKAAAAAQAQKTLIALQLNQSIDEEKAKQVALNQFAFMTGSEGKTGANVNLTENESLKLKRPIETLNQAEINELYAQLYGKYVPASAKLDGNGQFGLQNQDAKINVIIDETVKQVPDQMQDDAAFKLLSALHQTPEKFTQQAVTDIISKLHKPLSEGKAFAEKTIEANYEENSQTISPSLYVDTYDSTSPAPVKLKEVQQTVNLTQDNNKVKAKNPLESYFLQYGIQNHDHLFNDQPLPVQVTTTSPTTLSNEGLEQISTTEESITTKNPSYTDYQTNADYTGSVKKPSMLNYNEQSFLNHPLAGYKGNLDFAKAVNNPKVISYNHAGIENTEPPSLSISQGNSLPLGFKAGLDYTQSINQPGGLEYHQGGIDYSEAMKKPIGFDHPVVENVQTLNIPSVLSQDGIAYSGNKPLGLEYQVTTESQKSSIPSYSTVNAEYIDALKNPSNQDVDIKPKIMPAPLQLNAGVADFSKTSRSPESMVNTPSASDDEDVEYKFNTEYGLPSTENVETSSINSDNSTDENELRGGMGDEWTTLYQEVGAGDESQSRKPNIEMGGNLVQIGYNTGNEVINNPVQGNIDLANLCPECFKKIQAHLVSQIQTGGTSGGANGGLISIANLFKDSSLATQLQALTQQQQQGGQESGISSSQISSLYPSQSSSSSSSGTINAQGILEFIQNLDAQNQQNVQVAPENDQSLVKILEIVLKGNDDDDSSTNANEATTNLFTIENLSKVLEALERRKQTQPVLDKETSNLYMIMKLIFEMTSRQMQMSNANGDAGAYWLTKLTSLTSNPLMKYVYNLLRQTWLQEIMFQLYKNNYNLNVIRNPRWVAYLGAWRLPTNLMRYLNANYEYYDQNEYAVDYDTLGGYVQNAVAINPHSDAGVILAFLRNYLIRAEYYEQGGSVDFYRKQTEIFSRIAAYLRQRGYAVHVIQSLIRKLYAVLSANQALVTVPRPACINRH